MLGLVACRVHEELNGYFHILEECFEAVEHVASGAVQ